MPFKSMYKSLSYDSIISYNIFVEVLFIKTEKGLCHFFFVEHLWKYIIILGKLCYIALEDKDERIKTNYFCIYTRIVLQSIKIHSYCTAIALRCRYIDYFLPQVTAFQFKMNLIFMRHRNAITSQFLCRKMQCGNATQLRCSMNGP